MYFLNKVTTLRRIIKNLKMWQFQYFQNCCQGMFKLAPSNVKAHVGKTTNQYQPFIKVPFLVLLFRWVLCSFMSTEL